MVIMAWTAGRYSRGEGHARQRLRPGLCQQHVTGAGLATVDAAARPDRPRLVRTRTFLDRVVTCLRGAAADQPATPLTSQDVVRQRFSATKLRAGYDQQEVDDFLDRIVTELRRQESGQNSE